MPSARISLYDNPSGAAGLGSGTALDSVVVTGGDAALDNLAIAAIDTSGERPVGLPEPGSAALVLLALAGSLVASRPQSRRAVAVR